MPIKQFEIWIADLNPQIGTEPGKTRPVLTIQTNLLRNGYEIRYNSWRSYFVL